MLRKAKVYALGRLLLEHFGGKVAGAGPSYLPDVGNVQTSVVFAPVLTVCSQDSETRSTKGHNAEYKQTFAVEQRRHRAWT
jgi:hypothetical protein